MSQEGPKIFKLCGFDAKGCTKEGCRFVHPSRGEKFPCKFGTNCKNQADCKFDHALDLVVPAPSAVPKKTKEKCKHDLKCNVPTCRRQHTSIQALYMRLEKCGGDGVARATVMLDFELYRVRETMLQDAFRARASTF